MIILTEHVRQSRSIHEEKNERHSLNYPEGMPFVFQESAYPLISATLWQAAQRPVSTSLNSGACSLQISLQ